MYIRSGLYHLTIDITFFSKYELVHTYLLSTDYFFIIAPEFAHEIRFILIFIQLNHTVIKIVPYCLSFILLFVFS